MKDLNIRQRAFVRGITKEMKPASVAYADVYGGDPSDPNVQSMASRLSSNVKVEKTLEQIEENMHQYATEAFERNVKLSQDPKTPANVKNDINKHIQALGGMTPVQKVETKQETTYKNLNDDTSWLEEALKDIKERKATDK